MGTPPSEKRPFLSPLMRGIVIVTALVVVGVVSATVAIVITRPARSVTATASSTTTSTTAAISSASSSTSVPTTSTLPSTPVVACKTTYASSPPPTTSAPLPSYTFVGVPPDELTQLTYYETPDGGMQVLAPSGWKCSASFGSDGSGYVSVRAAGSSSTSPEAVNINETSACLDCDLDQACPLFTAAAQALSQQKLECPSFPPFGELDKLINSHVAVFKDPPGVQGDGEPSGGTYPANGVVVYPGLDTQIAGWKETCTLPPSENALCTASVNYFIQQYGRQ